MPMLAEVLSWQARVMHEPVAAPVANVLEKCAERLALLFTRYIQDMVLHSSQLHQCQAKITRSFDALIVRMRSAVPAVTFRDITKIDLDSTEQQLVAEANQLPKQAHSVVDSWH